ncbi:MAG: YiiX/YebB-like N1pC/P60 family cysteine hydrolase [Bacteroidota bacterium]|nr:YiiX/YebB-like N1pC/P60 family cysteine hydrolase [Bacteroidota bacterium]
MLLGLICFISLIFFSFLFISSFTHKKEILSINEEIVLQNGDLIFRRGRSLASYFVLANDKSSHYSHVGIIYKRNKQPFVIHVVPGESKGKPDYVKMEKITGFLTQKKASRYAICRLKNSSLEKGKQASETAEIYYKKKLIFDNNYDIKTENLFCTELVWKAYKIAGIDLIRGKFDEVNFPGFRKPMIMPGSLLNSNYIKLLYSSD